MYESLEAPQRYSLSKLENDKKRMELHMQITERTANQEYDIQQNYPSKVKKQSFPDQ